MPASEFDVLVVGAGGQLPVGDALFFVAGYRKNSWRLPAACPSVLPLVHQQGVASSPSTRLIISSLCSLAKEITTRARKVACKIPKPHLHAAFRTILKLVRILEWTTTKTNTKATTWRTFSEEPSKGCFTFLCQRPMMVKKTRSTGLCLEWLHFVRAPRFVLQISALHLRRYPTQKYLKGQYLWVVCETEFERQRGELFTCRDALWFPIFHGRA